MANYRPPNRTKKNEIKQCLFCTNDIDVLDYKDTGLLKNFLTYQFKIAPRKRTGTCSKHQRSVSNAIKRARMAALLPFTQHRKT